MKDKIIIFIIGLLFGAVISTGAFYIYTTTAGKCNCSSQNTQMNNGQPLEMPSGQNGQPPAKPSGENGQPPEMPNNTQNISVQENN